MRQVTLCVPLEVKPESCSLLTALVDAIKRDEDVGEGGIGEDGVPENFARVTREIPTLHFMSMSVFTDSEYDPLFILEANFDGEAGVFWGQVEAVFGERLREVLRCCKQPLDHDSELYMAVTESGSRTPVVPYFEARTQRPSVFHHGNRGLSRDRILREAKLFGALRESLDGPGALGPEPYRGLPAEQVHARLRRELLPAFAWLAESAPTRFPLRERLGDLARVLGFAVAVLFALSAPGIVAAALLPWKTYLLLTLIVSALVGLLIYGKRKPLPGTDVPSKSGTVAIRLRSVLLILFSVVAYAAVATALLSPSVFGVGHLVAWLGSGTVLGIYETLGGVATAVALGFVSLLVTVPLIILWLRYLELRDSSHDAPQINERMLREMVRREDWVAQNHMGSIVLIRPGVLRALIIRVGHQGLGLVLRLVAKDGYLGSMRTVHFAHWAFLNNRSRLLFFSNFDHSWDSYLDDFIEKAHGGLTLAWGCGVGFPPTRFLVYDGASHGRRFKNWALASRAVSRFWYSAYRKLTVDQIERNNRIANGLRRSSMTPAEACTWIRDL